MAKGLTASKTKIDLIENFCYPNLCFCFLSHLFCQLHSTSSLVTLVSEFPLSNCPISCLSDEKKIRIQILLGSLLIGWRLVSLFYYTLCEHEILCNVFLYSLLYLKLYGEQFYLCFYVWIHSSFVLMVRLPLDFFNVCISAVVANVNLSAPQ